MKKKILAIFLALAMIFAMASALTLTAAVRPGDLIFTDPAELLQGTVPGMIITAETPDYTPKHYGTGGDSTEVDLEDLKPGDILMDGVTLGTDIEWLETRGIFYVCDDLTDYFFEYYKSHIISTGLTCDELSNAFKSDGDFYGQPLMVAANYCTTGNAIYLVPEYDLTGSKEYGYGVFVYDENYNSGELIPITPANEGNVLGDGKVSYNSDDKILTLDGAEIKAVGPAIVSWLSDLTIELKGENSIEYEPDQERFSPGISGSIGAVPAIAVPFGSLSIIGDDPATDKLTVELNMDNCSKTSSLDFISAVISVWGGEYDSGDGTGSVIIRPAAFTIKDAAVDISCPVNQYFDVSGNPVSYDEFWDSWWETGSYWEIHAKGIEADGNVLLQNAVVSIAGGSEAVFSNYGNITIENCMANGDDAAIVVAAQGNNIGCFRGDVIIDSSKVSIIPNIEKSGIYSQFGDVTIQNGSEVDITANGRALGIDAHTTLTVENSTVTADVGILGSNIVITDSKVSTKGYSDEDGSSEGLNCISLTVNGSKSVVKSTTDGIEGVALFLHEDWENGAAPSLNVTDGLVQLAGTGAGIMIMPAEEGIYELNDLEFVGSTKYDDFDNATETVTIEWYGDYGSYISMIGGEFAKSVQIGSTVKCTYMKQTALREDALDLRLNGKDVGWFEFDEVKGGWLIRHTTDPNAEIGVILNPYLSEEDGKLVGTGKDDATVWQYDARSGFYVTETGATQTTGFWFLFWYIPTGTVITSQTYYLTANGNGLTVGTRAAATSFFEYVEASAHTPMAGYCVNLKDGTHLRYCTACGEYYTEKCKYDEHHECVCGAYDPTVNPVTVEVVDKGWTEIRGWFWTTYKVYTVKLSAYSEKVRVPKIEYSMDGERWQTGSTVTANAEIGHFYIRTTDANGAINYFEYVNGEIEGNPVNAFSITLTTQGECVGGYVFLLDLGDFVAPNERRTFSEIPAGTEIVVDEDQITIKNGEDTIGITVVTNTGANYYFNGFLFNGELVDDGTYYLTEDLTIDARVVHAL